MTDRELEEMMQERQEPEVTDRELLELAAKAAGFVLHHSYREKTNSLLWLSQSGFPATWRPLDDNGEAFGLALLLKMIIDPYAGVVAIPGKVTIAVVDDGNTDEAYRRAIVRAAAEIARSME